MKLESLFAYLTLKPKPKPNPAAPRYADVYGRAVAGAIDLMLVFLLFKWLFGLITAQLIPMIDQQALLAAGNSRAISVMFAQLWQAGLIPFWLVNAVLQFLVIGVCWVGCQQVFHTTPGKWLMGYRIVCRADHARTPSLARLIWRFFSYGVSCAPLMLGLFLAHFNREHRALHDRMAGTVVLNTRPPGWYKAQAKALLARARGGKPRDIGRK